MAYPRIIKLNGIDTLVEAAQCVGTKEFLASRQRILFCNGYIGAKCTVCGGGEFELLDTMLAMDNLSHEPIKLVITSLGGDLDSAFLIYDTMKIIKSPVITIGRYCASAAAILLAAGSKRYLFPHAKVMLHLPAGRMEGDSTEWDIQHIEMQKYKNRIVDVLCECGVKKSRIEIEKDIDRNFWLEPVEAINYGLADEIMTPEIWQEWTKEDKK